MPSDEWQEEYDGLLKSKTNIPSTRGYEPLGKWLKRKTDRSRRLKELHHYIDTYAAEIMQSPRGAVVDIGPGPGEFLEISRHYGHEVQGVDAESGEGGMGFGYLRVSQLMAKRQQIPIEYVGFREWLHNGDAETIASASFVNFRGSIEQALSHLMQGDHREAMDCRSCRWREDGRTRDEFTAMFARLKLRLQPGGHVLIYANGSRSDGWYDTAIQAAAREAGFSLVLREGKVIHKWRVE